MSHSHISGIHHITAIAADPQANVDFYQAFLAPEQGEWHQGITFTFNLTDQAINFITMHQYFSRTCRVGVNMGRG